MSESDQPVPGPSRPGAAVVEVDGLDAGYHGTPVVRDLTLHVGEGEVVALLGANGAGKTTTLATIAGLQRPLAGRIRMDGQDIGGKPAHRLARGGLSLVPEGRALFASLTTKENLRLSAGPGRSYDEVLDLLPELRKCLDRKAGLLSGGEQQMLAVGRAIPGVSRGDHHVARALEIAARGYVMPHGRLILETPAARLRTRRDLLKACYLGDLDRAAELARDE